MRTGEASSSGYWLVDVVDPGPHQLTVRHRGTTLPTLVQVKIGDSTWEQPWGAGNTKTLESLTLPQGIHRLAVDLTVNGQRRPAFEITVRTP